ncbi:hypothetical protein, partial [Mesorhizobium sp.]|uniref:hypothetical protein n=1 Tax=Mesorhizobium sp. TaxID=1871066 RepID=UPI0025B8E62B
MASETARQFVLTQFRTETVHSFPGIALKSFGCSDDKMVAEFVESKADQAGSGLSGPCGAGGHG